MAIDQESAPDIGPTLRLAELACTRLCNELGGAAKAVITALEPRSDGTAPVHEAAADLQGRINLARAAWGDGDEIRDIAMLRRLISGYGPREGGAIELVAEHGAIPAGMGQLLLNLVMLAADCLPQGGAINVGRSLGRSGAEEFVLVPEGPGAAWPAGFAGWIADPALAWRALDSARAFQAPFAVLMAVAKGYRLSLLMGVGPGMPPLLVSRPDHPVR